MLKIAGDTLYPVIVRATALTLLPDYPGEETDKAFERAMADDEALIRQTATRRLGMGDETRIAAMIVPLLYDPVKSVRMEAARSLAETPAKKLAKEEQAVFLKALDEFKKSMEYSADFAFGRYNLGNLYTSLGQREKAVENYRAAIAIDDLFFPAKVNLAMLYNAMGDKEKAETLLREVVTAHPQEYEIFYSLGLLLAEKKKYPEAARYLTVAAQGMPYHARAHYNLGQLLDYLQNDAEAEKALLRALEIDPQNIDFLTAAAHYYGKRGHVEKAKSLAEKLIAISPDNRQGRELLEFLKTQSGK